MRRYITLVETADTLPIPATRANIAKAKAFVFRKWTERARDEGKPEPRDLTNSCKFSSLFAQRVFGGKIRGNHDHQYVVLDGTIIDLNSAASDVRKLHQRARKLGKRHGPYHHDPAFWGNQDHTSSLRSCIPRVDQWVEEFVAELTKGKRNSG